MFSKCKFLIPALIAVMLTLSCDEEKNRIIPFVSVSFNIDLKIWNDLTVPGNSVVFPGAGYAGVIVYCEFEGSYYAYDAACTHEVSQDCSLKTEGILATCPCCGSKYILLGSALPSKGPASRPLQPYHVSVSGNRLYIYN